MVLIPAGWSPITAWDDADGCAACRVAYITSGKPQRLQKHDKVNGKARKGATGANKH